MVNFLRVYDPIRIVVLILLLFAIRLPYLTDDLPLIIPELEWMLTGEKLGSGNIMYRDMWHYLEPFSAGTYYFIDSIFGRSQLAYQIISLLLVLFQAFLVNYIGNSQNLFNERSLLPATLYIIFSSLFFDFFTLPPVLLSNTFLILAFFYFIIQIRFKLNEEQMFYCGILTGIASLFYLPAVIFLMVFLSGFIIYAATEPKKYLLLILSFLIPFLVTFTYYFLRNGGEEFTLNFISPFFTLEAVRHIDLSTIALILVAPGIALILSLLAVLSRASYINYQQNMIRILILWILAGIITLFLTLRFTPFQLYIFLPPLSMLVSHFFLVTRNKVINEAFFWTLLSVILLVNSGILYGFLNKKDPVDISRLIVGKPENIPFAEIAGKKILVLGYEPELYRNSYLGSPYYNWKLSRRHFKNLDKFRVLPELYQNLVSDLPEVIVDRKNVMEEVFRRLPELEKQYRKLENQAVYILIR